MDPQDIRKRAAELARAAWIMSMGEHVEGFSGKSGQEPVEVTREKNQEITALKQNGKCFLNLENSENKSSALRPSGCLSPPDQSGEIPSVWKTNYLTESASAAC